VVVLVLGAGALALGTMVGSDPTASATEPAATGGAPPVPPVPAEEADALKKLDKRLADLEKQKELLDATLADIRAERQKIEDARRDREAAAELGRTVVVAVGDPDQLTFTIREAVSGRIIEVQCSTPDALQTYLTRALADPKGPKGLRITARKGHPDDQLRTVFEACAAAGFGKAVLSQTEWVRDDVIKAARFADRVLIASAERLRPVEPSTKSSEIDLSKYAPKKP
jgi:hypothetical protein